MEVIKSITASVWSPEDLNYIFCPFQHYELDRENLQLLALRLSCRAHSLHNELCQETDSRPVSTQTLADVANVITAVKPLVCWLDRLSITSFTNVTRGSGMNSFIITYCPLNIFMNKGE